MKLKKFGCAVAAVVMSISAVSVSAAINVPTPKDNADAYRLAETFYRDGYYYEARAELQMINTNEFYYDANKQAAWMDKVNYKINRLAIKNIIAEAKKLNSELKFADGLAALEKANSYDITEDEYYLLIWWQNALTKNLNSPKYNKVNSGAVITSGVKAPLFTLLYFGEFKFFVKAFCHQIRR